MLTVYKQICLLEDGAFNTNTFEKIFFNNIEDKN